MAQRDHVVSLVWQWIKLIRSAVESDTDGFMKKYHEELRQISSNEFRFRENGDPTDFCSNAAERMFKFDAKSTLIGSSKPGEYSSKITKAFMDRFSPDNCMITVYDPDLDREDTLNVESEFSAAKAEWETEKWYHAKYRQVDIPEHVKEKWRNHSDIDSRLHPPQLNDFIPSDFSLRSDDTDSIAKFDSKVDYSEESPRILLDTPGLRLWHKLDRTFKVPKTILQLHLTSPNVYSSPRKMTLCRLYGKVLIDDLNSFVYDASIAGCNYRVDCVPDGFSILVSGYSEKLPNLLDSVISRMLNIIQEMKEGEKARPGLAQKFDKAKENLLRETKNFRLDPPYETASYMSRMMIEDNVSNY